MFRPWRARPSLRPFRSVAGRRDRRSPSDHHLRISQRCGSPPLPVCGSRSLCLLLSQSARPWTPLTSCSRQQGARVTFRHAGPGGSSVCLVAILSRGAKAGRRTTDRRNVRQAKCERLGSQHSASRSRSSSWTSPRRLPQARSLSTSSPPASATGTTLSGSAAGRSAAHLRWRSGRRRPERSQRPARAWSSCARATK